MFVVFILSDMQKLADPPFALKVETDLFAKAKTELGSKNLNPIL